MKSYTKPATTRPILKDLTSKIDAALEKNNVTSIPVATNKSGRRNQNNVYIAVAFFVHTLFHSPHKTHNNAVYISSDAKNIMFDPEARSTIYHPYAIFEGHIHDAIPTLGNKQNYNFGIKDSAGIATYFSQELKAALTQLANDVTFTTHPEFKHTIKFVFEGAKKIKAKRDAKKKNTVVKEALYVDVQMPVMEDFYERLEFLTKESSKIAVGQCTELIKGEIMEYTEATSARIFGPLTNMEKSEREKFLNGYWDVDIKVSITNFLYHEAQKIDSTCVNELAAINNYIKNKELIRQQIAVEANVFPRMVKTVLSALAHCARIPTETSLVWDEVLMGKGDEFTKSMFSLVQYCMLNEDEKEMMKEMNENIFDPEYNKHNMVLRLIKNESFIELAKAFGIMTNIIYKFYKEKYVLADGRSWIIPNAASKELVINLTKGQHFPKASVIAHIYQGSEAMKLHVFMSNLKGIIPYHDGFVTKNKISELVLRKMIAEIQSIDGEIIELEQKQYKPL